jgi:hypothetical protein
MKIVISYKIFKLTEFNIKGLCSASGCLKDLNEDNLPLMDGTKALADTVGNIIDLVMKVILLIIKPSFNFYQLSFLHNHLICYYLTCFYICLLIFKAAETPTEDFPKTLQLCQKIWDTSKLLLAKPSLINYADKGISLKKEII